MTPIRIAPGSPHDPGVPELFAAADAYALSLYPPEHYHVLDAAEFARAEVQLLVARDAAGAALGMVALVPERLAAPRWAELKRMFVHEDARGTGLGRALLAAVESAAAERGIPLLRLETGEPQAAAIRLYERWGFVRIPPFGEYVHDPTSICMEKPVTPSGAPTRA